MNSNRAMNVCANKTSGAFHHGFANVLITRKEPRVCQFESRQNSGLEESRYVAKRIALDDELSRGAGWVGLGMGWAFVGLGWRELSKCEVQRARVGGQLGVQVVKEVFREYCLASGAVMHRAQRRTCSGVKANSPWACIHTRVQIEYIII